MLERIGQRLLGDPVRRVIDHARQVGSIDVDRNVHGGAGCPNCVQDDGQLGQPRGRGTRIRGLVVPGVEQFDHRPHLGKARETARSDRSDHLPQSVVWLAPFTGES